MNESEKFNLLFGGIFGGIGVVLTVTSVVLFILREWFPAGVCTLLAVVFGAIGAGFLIALLKTLRKRKRVDKNGKSYTGKIYGYVEDKSFTMNGDYLVNTQVRYFDEEGTEREALIQTRFVKGTGDYPIGATIDIKQLGNEYSWDKNSVRYETIDREDELMDNKPLDPKLINMVAVECKKCGAGFTAAKGYVCTCPYCGNPIDN